ncbi:MAG: hypothetical protein DSM106950_31010 [Stigonema ocellatum SAG 48.90 = DSM 106950]|nr:hypothetical protein [Stigonema ocellatum SAG 48.90 = DSM 106950]
MQDVPWASLISDVNTNGENLAPGYVLDLPNSGYVGRTFNVQIYPGLQEKLHEEPDGLDGLPDDAVAFRFHILATATAMTLLHQQVLVKSGLFLTEQYWKGKELKQYLKQQFLDQLTFLYVL